MPNNIINELQFINNEGFQGAPQERKRALKNSLLRNEEHENQPKRPK